MSSFLFEYTTDRIILRDKNKKRLGFRECKNSDRKKFSLWISRYREALKKSNQGELLLKLGQDIFNWLNVKSEKWMEIILKDPTEPLFIEFKISASPQDDELQFIEIPWELLADEAGFLAAQEYRKYCPVRRIGDREKPSEASAYRLSLMFMAAAPRGSVDLKYEQEEYAILRAVGEGNIDLTVEETGNIDLLSQTISDEDKVDVLHISCHGNSNPQPVLSLEDEEGDPDLVKPADFVLKLPQNKPPLLFLSACQTSDPDELLNSYSANLIRHKYPAVLGWGGSVYDHEATEFASYFYNKLASKSSIEHALALARYLLLNRDSGNNEGPSRDWHLARLYLGSAGGGVLTNGKKARRLRSSRYGHKEFLDLNKDISVASRYEFVGRRSQLQTILRQFRTFEKAGVLIH